MPRSPGWWLVALVVVSACGPRPLPPASPLDTPDAHYREGLALLDAGDLWGAQAAFERVHGLAPDHPGSYVGSALVAMEQGEYHRALQEVEEALHRDRRCADAYIARGRVLTAQGR
ncbi:MAG: tetratricopeptide repeat protein, partial [Gemmatimonadota bacterium]